MALTSQDNHEETGIPVFQPDTVLPSQFFGALREKGFVEGEKRLMAAVLADAVECYMKNWNAVDARGRSLFEEAEAWIYGDAGGDSFFSFRNICDVLGLDSDYLAEGLEKWRQRRTATIRPADVLRRPASSPHTTVDGRQPLRKVG